jgi:TraY domain
MAVRKRPGRPATKRRKPGDRVPVTVRLSVQAKRNLDESARRSGRSQSQEAELLIEHAFDREDILTSVMALAWGRDTAALLIAIGDAIGLARFNAHVAEYQLRDSTDENRDGAGQPPRDAWAHDPLAFETARLAVIDALVQLAPRGPLTVNPKINPERLGSAAAREAIQPYLQPLGDGHYPTIRWVQESLDHIRQRGAK